MADDEKITPVSGRLQKLRTHPTLGAPTEAQDKIFGEWARHDPRANALKNYKAGNTLKAGDTRKGKKAHAILKRYVDDKKRFEDALITVLAIDVLKEVERLIEEEKKKEALNFMIDGEALERELRPALDELKRQIAVLEHKISSGKKLKAIEPRRLIKQAIHECIRQPGVLERKSDFVKALKELVTARGLEMPSDRELSRILAEENIKWKQGNTPKKR